ncbi:MAG: hypothetical protein HYZ85_04050 [Candidatus Omnitrophica bacterium]|nr:hypothetical protein [Candidatus Omnitrophota bacterium]
MLNRLIFLGAVLMVLIELFIPPYAYPEEIRYLSGGRRDPFQPLITKEGMVVQGFNPSDLKVEGIIFDPRKGSLVLINGDFYKQGDSVKEAKIISIFKDRVILSQNDEKKELWLREEILPQETAKEQGKDETKKI